MRAAKLEMQSQLIARWFPCASKSAALRCLSSGHRGTVPVIAAGEILDHTKSKKCKSLVEVT